MKTKSEDKRLAILRAAFAVVTECGYSDTKVEDVAQRAGVAKGTVYLYFRDKPAIYIGLVGWLLEQALALLTGIRAERISPRAKLERVFEVWSTGVFSKPGVGALLSLENVDQSNTVMKRFRKQVLPRMHEVTGAVAEIIEEGIAGGEFRPVDPRLAAMMYMGAFSASMHGVTAGPSGPESAKSVEELFFCGLLARPKGHDRIVRRLGSCPRSKTRN